MKQEIRDILRDILTHASLPESLQDSDNIVLDYGFNSLNMMEFILKLEQRFGIEIDLDKFDLSIFNSVAGLCQFLEHEVTKQRQ